MGSIATIPLMGTQAPAPTQITNPLQLQQQRLTLQQLANTNAISQQVQQENALKLQAQQEDQNDQQTFQKALQNNTKVGADGHPTTDWDAALTEASPNMRIRNVQGIQNDHYALLKNAAEATQLQRDQWTNNNTAIGRALAYVYQTPNEQRPEAYTKARQDLIDQGVIKPDDPRYPAQMNDLGDNTLLAEIARVGYLDTVLKQGQERATTASTTQKTSIDLAKAQRAIATEEFRAIPPDPTTGLRSQAAIDALRAKYKTVEFPDPATGQSGEESFISSSVEPKDLPDYLIKTAQAKAYSQMKPEDWDKQVDAVLPPSGDSAQLNATTKADIHNGINMKLSGKDIEGKIDKAVQQLNEQRKSVMVAKNTLPVKVELAQQTAAAQQAQGFAAPGDTTKNGEDYLATLPIGLQNTVKAIVEGRQDPITGFAMTRGPGAAIMNAVNHYDPEWSNQRAQIRKSFITGPEGKTIGANNTAVVHLDQLADAADALKNGSFTPGNTAYNYFASLFGSNPPTNFDGLKAAVSGELATALKGNATDQEIANISSNINKSQSPDQLKGAVDTNLHILGAKLNTYHERYNQQIPGGDKYWSPILPTAERVFTKHGIVPGALGSDLPQGNGKVIDKETARQFYKAAGNDPAKAQKLAEDHNWKVQ